MAVDYTKLLDGNSLKAIKSYVDNTFLKLSGGKLTGSLEIVSSGSSWNEGIRIHPASNGWSGIVLCESSNSGGSGSSAKTWSMHNNEGVFGFYQNGSNIGSVTAGLSYSGQWIMKNGNGNQILFPTAAGTIALVGNNNHTHTKSQITDFPTSMPASDVYAWAKASTKPSYSFSEISNRYDTLLGFSGSAPNVVGNVSAIGMAISPEHGANRLAFVSSDALYFEYSTDGTNYTELQLSNDAKRSLVTTSYGVPVGRASGEYTVGSKTRITITGTNASGTGYFYCSPKKMLINISSSGGMNVLVEYRSGTNTKSGGAWSTYGTYSLSGWSGWNEIPLVLGTLGGGSTQTDNIWQLRLTFIMTSKSTSYPTTAYVNMIRLFADNIWNSPSTMASSGHLYSYDIEQNAFFPANIYEGGTALSSKYLALSGGVMTGPLKWSGATRELLCTAYNDSTWKGGIKYSWASNTTIAIWGKHQMSQFVWHAGTDFSENDVNGTTTKTYDFQVGRDASGGAPIGRIGGNIIATLSEDQNITGVKTFINQIKFKTSANSTNEQLTISLVDAGGGLNCSKLVFDGCSYLEFRSMQLSLWSLSLSLLRGQYQTIGSSNVECLYLGDSEGMGLNLISQFNSDGAISFRTLNSDSGLTPYKLKVPSTVGYTEDRTIATTADIPTSLPASDVYAWAKASTKPSYNLDEVTDGSTRKLDNYLSKSGGTMGGNITLGSGASGQTQVGASLVMGIQNDSYGLLPYSDNWNQIGADGRRWYRAYISNVYGTTIYENGTSLVNKYLGKSDQAADSAKLGGVAASSYATQSWAQGLMTPTAVGQGQTKSNVNGYTGATFTIGTSGYGGLYIFTYGNCMILLPIYGLTANTEYKVAASLVNSYGSYSCKVLTYRYVSSSGTLQIYQKENYIPTGYGCALFKVKLY